MPCGAAAGHSVQLLAYFNWLSALTHRVLSWIFTPYSTLSRYRASTRTPINRVYSTRPCPSSSTINLLNRSIAETSFVRCCVFLPLSRLAGGLGEHDVCQ